MTFQEAMAALAALENGATIITAINGELTNLRGEAAGYRTKNKKLVDALTTLGVTDLENLDGQVSGLKAGLDVLKESGNPGDIANQLKNLTGNVAELKANLDKANADKEAERSKRLEEVKRTKAIEALTKGKAVNPTELSKLILGNIQVKDDDKLVYLLNGQEVEVETGVSEYLKTNPVFVANTQAAGGGGNGGGGTVPDKNPWSKEHHNLTEQGKIVKEHPELAQKLMAEANKK